MSKTTIDPTKYTRHLSPGKFEGEQPETEYFYEQLIEGDGEELYLIAARDEDDDFCEDSPLGTIFRVNADEAEAFDLPIGAYFLLREDTQGFAYGSVHASRAAAEARFREWGS